MSPTFSQQKEGRESTGTPRLASLDASDDIHKDDNNGVRTTPPTKHRGDA